MLFLLIIPLTRRSTRTYTLFPLTSSVRLHALHRQPDAGCCMDVEPARFDEEGVHRRVEEFVIDRVVDVAIGVVVVPARLDRQEEPVSPAGLADSVGRLLVGHRPLSPTALSRRALRALHDPGTAGKPTPPVATPTRVRCGARRKKQ